ncbi:PKD domain-containing protein [Jatrophihabitans sp.]|uniref:PKD domain-containing protein n=1 Tax=Jatrophihabitans sp. TaxID=1932789 RepID=UPI0030C73E15
MSLIILSTVGAAAVAGLVAVPSAGATSSAASTTTTAYEKAVPVCGKVTGKHVRCFAMKLVRSTFGAAGAHAMAAKPSYAEGPAGGYSPAAVATAYGITPSATTTVKVGIVDAYGDTSLRADVGVFDAKYGLPGETPSSLKIVGQTGGATPTTDSGWGVEQSLDVEAVRGLCNKCQIIVVEASSAGDADLATAENEAVTLGATVVSNSFGQAESASTPDSTFIAAFAHKGVAQVASTGDDGWFDWDGLNKNYASSDSPALPAALPTTVAVGGTSLYLNDNGTRASETVWNENGPADQFGLQLGKEMGASGGGCSTLYTAPAWQHAVAGFSGTGCGTKRLAADISAIADPFTGYDIYDSFGSQGLGWETIGGTSLAAPVISAMWALAGGPAGVATPALSLYGHFKSDTTKPYYDVQVGGNGICGTASATACSADLGTTGAGESPNTVGYGQVDCYWAGPTATLATSNGQCHAKVGYDGPSGVGTPKGTALFKALNPTAKITAPTSITHGKTAAFKGTTSTDPFPGGTITKYSWTWGDGSAATAGSAPTHKYAKAGKYSVKLVVTDSYGRVSPTLVHPVTVK